MASLEGQDVAREEEEKTDSGDESKDGKLDYVVYTQAC